MKDEWKASNGDTCATNDCVILMTGGFRAWVFYSLSFNPVNHSRWSPWRSSDVISGKKFVITCHLTVNRHSGRRVYFHRGPVPSLFNCRLAAKGADRARNGSVVIFGHTFFKTFSKCHLTSILFVRNRSFKAKTKLWNENAHMTKWN